MSAPTQTAGAPLNTAALKSVQSSAYVPERKPPFPRFVDFLQYQLGLRDRDEESLPLEIDDRIRALLRRKHQTKLLRLTQILLSLSAAAGAAYSVTASAAAARFWSGGILLFLSAIFLVGGLSKEGRVRDLEGAIHDAEFERDIESTVDQPQRYAARLLNLNQQQLRSYYDVMLRQSRQVFILGVVCTGLGLGVVVYALSTIGVNKEWPVNTLVGVLGALSTLMSGYIASVFLKMYAATNDNFAGFHTRLASANDLFLANLLASGVDEATRTAVVKELAVQMVSRPGPDRHDERAKKA